MNSQENPSGIYDVNTFGVWHLSEMGNGTIDEYKDSSIYNNHGQGGEGDSLYVPTRTSGIIGFAQDFNDLDGKYDLIDCGNNSIFDISGNQITMQAWIKHNITPQEHYYGIMNHKGWYDGYSLWIEQNSLKLAFNLPGDTHRVVSDKDITTNTWHHVVATYDGSYMRIYIDGVQDINNLTKVNNILPSSSEKDFWIGHGDQPKDKIWSGEYEGQIDEVRISNVARSADWIATEYTNQINPNSFYSIGNQITGDITPPDITINSPNPNDLFGLSAPNYDLTVIDDHLDSIWYSFNGGANSTPVSASGTLDEAMWDALSNGTVTIRFYANDTIGYLNYEEVTVRKDILSPTITINNPSENDLFGFDAPTYDLTVSDPNLDSIWYSLNEGITNSTPVTATGTIDQYMWSLEPNGTVTIRFYANDTVGNINYEDVIVLRDIIEPSILINSPNPNDLFGFNAPTYDLTVSDANLDSIWYSFNGGTNSTPVSASGVLDQTMWNALSNGTVTIRFYANDTLGNLNFVERLVLKDILSPIMNIIEPNNYDLFGDAPPYVNLIITDGNLDQVWYQLQNASISTSNYTWTGIITQSVWDQVGNGTVTIRFYANDTIGNLENVEVIVYKDIYLPIITIINPTLNEVCNGTAPSFTVALSGSNLNSTWYTLNNGVDNYTFTGLTGSINPSAWTSRSDGIVTIQFYINNTLGVLGFDEVTVIKDTIAPLITINLPLNNTYCGVAPIINALVTDANLDIIWYEVNITYVLLANNVNQQLETSIWSSLLEGEFYIYIYANDSASNLSDPLIIRLYKDTNAPSAPNLITFPQGEVSGNLLFEWDIGSDPSGILKYRLIIDNEANPFATPGFVFEINITGSSYTFTGTLQPGTYYFFLYQIDGAGNQSPASTRSFSISSPSQPSEFPIWIIFVIIGAAIAGVVGIVVLKKSKSKKKYIPQIPEKKPVAKPVKEVPKEISPVDYDILKVMSHNELTRREENLLDHIRYLEENKKYTKAAELIGELILIEEILGNSQEVKLYRQKQIDIAIMGLEYLKDQYEIESKKAALSGDYSKALELYNESKVISDNLKGYMEHQKLSDTQESTILETIETQPVIGEVGIVYSCMNDLLTKYFDDIGVKYYSDLQIYEDIQTQIHGLILADQLQLEDIDPLVRERIKSIQIVFTDDISNAKVTELCQTFYNPYVLLLIVGIKWPNDVEAQIIGTPPAIGIEYQENIRIIHYELFITLIGLKGAYEIAFKEIIDLYDKSEIEILRETQESSEVIIHSTDELRYDLKEKGLITDKLEEYFNR
ncbi:MAG: LamG-like jellyroll fold domain-containing protein [Promethearchaeota archaeon]